MVIVWEGTCPQGEAAVGVAYGDATTPVRPSVFEVPCPAHAAPVDHSMTMQQVLRDVTCEWFAGCNRVATHLEGHPILGQVPACDACPRIGQS